MSDDFIRRLIRTVMESFRIDGAKKAKILHSIVGQKSERKANQ